MSSSELQSDQPSIPLDEYVNSHRRSIQSDTLPFLLPVLEQLQSLHRGGQAHGGVCPAAFRFKGEVFDADYFNLFQQGREPLHGEMPTCFVAPEVRDGGKKDPSSDCYSLGAVMFEIIAEMTPPESPEVMQSRLSEIKSKGDWNDKILNVVKKCLLTVKEKRLSNADEFFQFLRDQRKQIPVEETRDFSVPEKPERGEPFHAFELRLRDRLPNASVGRPYLQKLSDVLGDDATKITDLDIILPGDTGLVYDKAAGTLQGMPSASGEQRFVLTFRRVNEPSESREESHSLLLTVNPDPSTLWKNEPSDPDAKFAKPDRASEALVSPHVTILAASIRGRSHAHEAKYRDDDFGIGYIALTGWHVLITADGAGSAQYSRRGSQIACERTLNMLIDKLSASNDLDAALEKLGVSGKPEDLEKLRRISCNLFVATAYEALTSIRKEAADHGATLRDFATTYIVVIARKLQNEWFIASFSVGDGGAGILDATGNLTVLTHADSGDFAGQTLFLTMSKIFNDTDDLLKRTSASFYKDFCFLALMTDGISDPIFKNDVSFANAADWEKWKQELDSVVSLEDPKPTMKDALMSWMDFASPGNHDDRTIILVIPLPTVQPAPRHSFFKFLRLGSPQNQQ